MLTLIISIAILGLLAWAVSILPIPEPFAKIIQVVLIVIAVITVIQFLLGLNGAHTVLLR